MAAGLASPEMAAAGADVANFATGGATSSEDKKMSDGKMMSEHMMMKK